jgi:hypothetical protein
MLHARNGKQRYRLPQHCPLQEERLGLLKAPGGAYNTGKQQQKDEAEEQEKDGSSLRSVWSGRQERLGLGWRPERGY